MCSILQSLFSCSTKQKTTAKTLNIHWQHNRSLTNKSKNFFFTNFVFNKIEEILQVLFIYSCCTYELKKCGDLLVLFVLFSHLANLMVFVIIDCTSSYHILHSILCRILHRTWTAKKICALQFKSLIHIRKMNQIQSDNNKLDDKHWIESNFIAWNSHIFSR